LFEDFAVMLGDKAQRSKVQARSRLEEWMGRDKASGVAELKALAVKLLQDKMRGSGRDDPAVR
jgi:hypothetical protein